MLTRLAWCFLLVWNMEMNPLHDQLTLEFTYFHILEESRQSLLCFSVSLVG
jgi:hypothetical protein